MSIRVNNIDVTVVIPCRNEEKYIETCIRSIVEGTSSNIQVEIIVVNGMSSDNSVSILNKLKNEIPHLKLIENTHIKTQFALNLGIMNATGEYVMIAGAHSSFPDGYMNTMIENIQLLNADGAGGSLITDVLHKTNTSVAIKKVLSHPAGVGNSMFRIGVKDAVQVDTVPFGVYKKSIFHDVGLYNEKLDRNHDIEWSKRAIRNGKKIWLIPNKQCVYYARESYKDLSMNNFRNGMWNILAVVMTRTFRSLSIRHFVPALFVSSLFFFPILGLFFPPFLFVFAGILFLYLLSISFFSIKMNDQKTKFHSLVYAFIVLHFSYGIGSIAGVFKSFSLSFKKQNK